MSALGRFATDDFVWWNPGFGDMSVAKVSAMVVQMEGFLKAPVALKLVDVIGEDDKVAVEAEGYAELRNGKIYNNRYHFKFIVQDEKIAVIKEYHDTHHAFETFMAG